MVYPNRTQASGVWKLNNSNSVTINNLAHKKLYSQFPDAGNRAIFFGGRAPGEVNTIDFITMTSTGNAADFGDLPSANVTNGPTGATSPTRAVFAGGYFASSPNATNAIAYVEIMTTGNAVDFGDLAYSTITNGLRSSSNGHGGL